MTIRKTLLLTLIVAIASLGLTGCKEKSDHSTADHPTKEAVVEQANEAADQAAETAEEAEETVEKAAAEHPTEHPTEHPK